MPPRIDRPARLLGGSGEPGIEGNRLERSPVTARGATVKTRGPARILVLTASGFRTLMKDVPSIKDKVLAALTARIPDEYE